MVVVAHLLRVRGNKGEVAAVPLSDHPERLTRVFVNGVPLEVERIWPHGDRLIFKFAGVDSISDAEKLEGLDVMIPEEERAELPEGEYYHSDLVGCEVVDLMSGRSYGTVAGWQEHGGPALLEVKGADGKEILIPFANAICKHIDPVGRWIGVELPEGLDDL